jgi:ATP-binding cassette subfamily C (CFTR/MRP) protein 1
LAQLLYYGNLKVEAAPKLTSDPKAEWPSEGRVSFNDVKLRYRKDTPVILDGISFDVSAGEKVGEVVELCAGRMLTRYVL